MYTKSEQEQKEEQDFLLLLNKLKTNIQNQNKKEMCIKSGEYSSYLTFKGIISELFYQAINSIPHDISEYTIHCTNNKGTTSILIGIFDELDDDGEIAVAKIFKKGSNAYILNKTEIHTLYIANRSQHHNKDIINSIMMLLYLDGHEPRIKTSYKSVAKQHFYKKLKNLKIKKITIKCCFGK